MRHVYRQQWQRQEKQGHIVKFDSFIKENDNKNQADKDRNRGRISIGDHVERYTCIRVKTELNLSFHKKNREVAGILLNMFMVYLSHVFTL